MTSNGVFQDFSGNMGRPIIQLVLILFRSANFFRASSSRLIRVLGIPVAVIYRAVALTVANIDIPAGTSIGRRLQIHHGTGLVINRTCRLGDDVILRHCTTLGSKSDLMNGPSIGSRVDIGPNSIVLGDIVVGDDSTIGAGSVVLKDINPGLTVAGNPAKPLGA